MSGLDAAQVRRSPDRSMPENLAVLGARDVEVMQAFQPFVELAVEDGVGHIWYAAASRGLTAYTSLYTTRQCMARDPESLLRMTRAMYRTQQWIATHSTAELAACVAAFFPDLPSPTLTAALERYKTLHVWKGTVALAAAASVGVATTTRWRRAEAQESTALPRARIDGVLRQAVDAQEVPGVVAMTATDKGRLYEGAFGTRALDTGPAMTLDTVFRIASMTKAITSVAAMQLVEQGKLTLDDPVPNIDPALGSPQVLEGFDAAGAPRLRPAKRPITLRHLLTHTAGFCYELWDANTVRYVKTSGMPALGSGKV